LQKIVSAGDAATVAAIMNAHLQTEQQTVS